MACEECTKWVDIEDPSRPHVVRTCSNCGRKVRLREPGKDGHGIQVNAGDQFVLPAGWLTIAANPLKGAGRLTKHGLEWFAKLIFVEDIKSEDDLDELISNCGEQADKVLEDSDLLGDLDLEQKDQAETAIERLKERQDTAEWWALLVGTFNSIAKDAVASGDARKAAWSMRAAERCRAMYVFKAHLEEVVWMGHSAGRLVEVLKKWKENKENSKEQFWQRLFKDNPYVLTQMFSVPVVFVGDNAYVGGMSVDRSDARFVDYLYANASSNDALLVEIKTPVTKLLGSKYRRSVYKPSAELSGAVVQALDYRRQLTSDIAGITETSEQSLDVFGPRCVVVVGNAEAELSDDAKRKSFELYRTSLKDVEIVTYDELFKKAESLASLFNLVAKRSEM